MKRRNFVQAIMASALIPSMATGRIAKFVSGGILKPQALKHGNNIGIIAPGTAVSDPTDIQKAYEIIEYLGLKGVLGEHVLEGNGYKSRTVDERLDDMHSMFSDSSISGVFCIRGGYGSGQLLDGLDYKLIKNNPKIFLGYSDITALHSAIMKETSLVTFHGPVLLSGFSEFTMNHLQRVLFDNTPVGIISNPESGNGVRETYPINEITPGIARGRLVGGNLSLISSLMGTPYEIETKNRILFIEDVGEEPYRIDRMLTQLRLAGKLNANGIIFGLCAGCNSSGLKPSRVWDYSLGEVLENILGNLGIPVFYGLTIGHTTDQLTLPYNVEVEMDASKGTLNILEAAVV